MENKCCFCGKNYIVPKFQSGRTRYCNDKCNKRAFYLRKHTGKSIFKNSEGYEKRGTGKGRAWEKILHSILGGTWHNELYFSAKPDIEVNGVFYDIKASEFFMYKAKQWVFVTANVNKPDFYVLILLDGGKPVNCYTIPGQIVGKGITLGFRSKKYRQFQDTDLLNKILGYETI